MKHTHAILKGFWEMHEHILFNRNIVVTRIAST